MKQDVLDALSGRFGHRVPCKETLNHPGIIEYVSGIDVYEDTANAFEIAWRKLGIDIHVPLPKENAPRPKVPGGTWKERNLRFSDIGVYPATVPAEYYPGADKADPQWVFKHDPSQDGFAADEQYDSRPEAELHATFRKAGGLQGEGKLGTVKKLFEISEHFSAHFGDEAVMYHLYYTTLFMWPVVTFGWEPFMIAAATEPERFDKQLWEPWSKVSRGYSEVAAKTADEVVFFHDDLVTATGPVFAPEFYEKYIFSRYDYIMAPAAEAGKKIVFVCDGNMEIFLERLLDFPIAAIMFENPATSFDRVLKTWGKTGRGFIGGIATEILTNGTPQQVRTHTKEVIEKGREYPGFIISSCGGLHGNIPMENILTYFKTRNEMGITAEL